MKILLVRPEPDRRTLGLQHIMLCEPLELEYMAAVVKDIPSVEVSIADMILESVSFEQVFQREKPDIVGFTGYITHVSIILDLAERARKLSAKVITVAGGVHCEVVPEDFNSPWIDYIINENALFTFPALVRSILSGRPFKDKILNSRCIPGFVPFSETVMHMPVPDRCLTQRYRQNYYYAFHNPPGALLKTSFGCPFSCNFCFCREITSHRYYERPLQEVIEEIKGIREKEIYIVDDNFLCNRQRLETFMDLLEEEGLEKHFLVYGRADFIAAFPDLIKRFRKAGLTTVIIGYESFRPSDLEKYNKKSALNSCLIATRILQSLDIDIYGTFILGMDWTPKDFRDFLKYLKMLKLRFVNLQPLTPIPGTPLFNDFKDDLLISTREFEKWDLAHITVRPENMSVRKYYFLILWTYLMLSFTPGNMLKNIRKYSFSTLLKITFGTRKIILQYLEKIIRG